MVDARAPGVMLGARLASNAAGAPTLDKQLEAGKMWRPVDYQTVACLSERSAYAPSIFLVGGQTLFRTVLSALVALVLLLGLLPVAAAPVPPATDGRGASPLDIGAPLQPGGRLGLPAVDPDAHVRAIVQLDDQPLADYKGHKPGLGAPGVSPAGGRRLDVASPASQAYLSYLNQRQSEFMQRLGAVSPGARVGQRYGILLNGLATTVRAGDLPSLRAIPGVKAVTIEQEYDLQMDASLGLIGLGTGTVGEPVWSDSGMWAELGGHANAGAGVKVAVIDSGITLNNPCFDPTGYSYPPGFPKYGTGYASYVNPKVIAARAYFRAADPPLYSDTPADDPAEHGGGHGTHTAGTVACNYGTTTDYPDVSGRGYTKISGVAPRAQIMVYRVFYYSESGDSSAWTPELVAAIEDAVADGAEVVNNSWGSLPLAKVADDPLVQAYNAAVAAGVTVVFSNGNSGPTTATTGSPAISPEFISVGASTTQRIFAHALDVTGPAPVSAGLSGIAAVPGDGPAIASTFSGAYKYYAYDDLGCSDYPAGTFTGKIALIKRGECTFMDKVTFAYNAGATAVVVRNNVDGPPISMGGLSATTIPSVLVSDIAGVALADWAQSNPTTAALRIGASVDRLTEPAWNDLLAAFSSRGPTPGMDIKPDLTAPGVNTLSSYAASSGSSTPAFTPLQGTSMAAPHVAGAAALLKQKYPTWTPAMIKSALVNSAAEPASLGDNPVERGAGRLDLAQAGTPTLLFDPVSVSFGLTTSGSTYQKTVTVRNLTGNSGQASLSVVASKGSAPVLSTTALSVPANGTATFDLTFTPTTSLSSEDRYGKVVVSLGGFTAHVPYWTKTVAALPDADVILIDGDDSPYAYAGGTCADYQRVYKDALDDLGVSYVVWDAYDRGWTIDFNVVKRYPKAIYFGGDPWDCGGSLSVHGNALRNYLADGGEMIVMGQDNMMIDNALNYYYGVSFSPEVFFGAGLVADSVFGSSTPSPAAVGDVTYGRYLVDNQVDLNFTLQTSVDELQAQMYYDIDALPILTAAGVSASGAGHIGTRMSSEPTIERVLGKTDWTALSYRTQLLSFGLEGVMDGALPYSNKARLLDRLLAWLDDEVSVSFGQPNYTVSTPGTPLTVTANASTSIATTITGFANAIEKYRWDFGDDSSVKETAGNSVSHTYAAAGTYSIRVEAIDRFGHKAVSQAATVQVNGSPTGTPASTPVGTPTPGPNGTPINTPTAGPSSTPVPTHTPVPTATPTPGPTFRVFLPVVVR